MPTQRSIFDEDPSIDGPDYVALVIEWDELADDLERQLRANLIAPEPEPQKRRWPKIVLGAAGLLGLVGTVLLARRLHD